MWYILTDFVLFPGLTMIQMVVGVFTGFTHLVGIIMMSIIYFFRHHSIQTRPYHQLKYDGDFKCNEMLLFSPAQLLKHLWYWLREAGNAQTNRIPVKTSHMMLLSQWSLCISGLKYWKFREHQHMVQSKRRKGNRVTQVHHAQLLKIYFYLFCHIFKDRWSVISLNLRRSIYLSIVNVTVYFC